MTIFKAYDIRGTYPEEINEEIAELIGKAFVAFTKTRDVMIGIDARTHSPALRDAFIRGAISQGATITDIGLITTSQMIALKYWKNHDTAVMVTASHLDSPFNGFKMLTGSGQYISEMYGMKDIESLVHKNNFTHAQPGNLKHASYVEDYAKKIATLCKPKSLGKPFVVDCSNGSAGPEVHAVAKLLGLNLVVINDEPDGTFPNHSPNPISPGAADQAGAAVIKQHAAGGCIFDADADRIIFLDEFGKPIHPNYTSCLLIERLLKENPGSAIAYDLISSRAVPETIRQNGGLPVRAKVGRANVIAQMMQTDAVFGAESSSHLMFKVTGFGEATVLALLYLLDTLAHSGKKLSELAKQFARYALMPETNYRISDKDEAIKRIKQAFPDSPSDELDGVTIHFSYGWLNARKSNTEPVLRIRAEADTDSQAAELMQQVDQIIRQFGGEKHVPSH